LIPPAMRFLLQDKRLNLQGFLCPGHVSCIIGSRPYEFIPREDKVACCIAGFEPLDILEALYLLILQINRNKPRVDNQYARLVTKDGNARAKRLIAEVFATYDATWRGLGKIPLSGLRLKREYASFDAAGEFGLNTKEVDSITRTRCRCALVLRGLCSPCGCPMFAKKCTPLNPLGPCMVSSEGACNAYYRGRL
jgi:hydrogenase expression/formation protein HypD